jgi:competence protein ComEA
MNVLSNLIASFKSGDKRVRLLVAVGAALAATLVGYLWPTSTSVISASPPVTPGPQSSLKTQITSPNYFVHLTGRVKHPGVYQVAPGTHLFEVIALAGGFSIKADQSSVNLARTINDGEQVVVASMSGNVTNPTGSSNRGQLRLNQATSEELESLPGVGPKLAGRIIDWRTANGGFAQIADLLEVGGIGDKLYAAIKPMVSL